MDTTKIERHNLGGISRYACTCGAGPFEYPEADAHQRTAREAAGLCQRCGGLGYSATQIGAQVYRKRCPACRGKG